MNETKAWMRNRTSQERSRYIEDNLLDQIPFEPEKVRATELFDKAGEMGIGQATVSKYLKTWQKKGIINRISETHKQVYYQRSKKSKILSDILELRKIIDSLASHPEGLIEEGRKESDQLIEKLKRAEKRGKDITPILRDFDEGSYHRILQDCTRRLISMQMPSVLRDQGAPELWYFCFTEKGSMIGIPRELIREKFGES